MDESLWFATRAAGLVTLALLTGSLVLGITTAARASRPYWPRFALAALHRNIALLSVLFLGVHVTISIIDPGGEVRWLDVLVPFTAGHHQPWLGLGSVAFDLLLASIAAGMLRARLGLRLWRAVHWASYASWPAALLHGVMIEENRLSWVIGFKVGCLAAVLLAVLMRRRPTRDFHIRAHRRVAAHGR